jgi:hypothetical protein
MSQSPSKQAAISWPAAMACDEAPYRVLRSERRTAMIIELWLHPLDGGALRVKSRDGV